MVDVVMMLTVAWLGGTVLTEEIPQWPVKSTDASEHKEPEIQ